MPNLPSSAVQASCLLTSVGFILGVMVASCSPEHRTRVRDVIEVVETVCDLTQDLDPNVKEVCVTEEEFRKAIKDIVSSRKPASGSSSKGNLIVRVKLCAT